MAVMMVRVVPKGCLMTREDDPVGALALALALAPFDRPEGDLEECSAVLDEIPQRHRHHRLPSRAHLSPQRMVLK